LDDLVSQNFVCPLSRDVFKPLFGDVRYLKLKRKNAILRSKLQEKSDFQYKVYLPENYSTKRKYPVFFNLHGDGDNVDRHKKYWKPEGLLRKEFIVVYPQSSQVIYHDGFAWCKRLFNAERIEECTGRNELYNGQISRSCYDLAHYEMRGCYDEIIRKYSVDRENILIGGMSGGATAALEFTMADLFPIKGFITLCPELQPSGLSKESVKMAVERGVKGVFMEGEHARMIEDEQKMLKLFQEVGLPCEAYVNKGIGHWYPDDLDEKVERAIEFII
jgi:predicted esterase